MESSIVITVKGFRLMPTHGPVSSVVAHDFAAVSPEFGDEKARYGLAGTALFGPGRISWELLRCHPVHPPFAWREAGPGSVLLVVENQATFDSLSRVLPDDGPVGVLAYSAGNHFTASVIPVSGHGSRNDGPAPDRAGRSPLRITLRPRTSGG
jgi:hypothetical protein